MENKVEWRDIPEYEEFYQVSSDGRIKSLKRAWVKEDRILKSSIDKKGYKKVNLAKNRVIKTFRVHTLVAKAFLNHKANGMTLVVDHINNDRADNRVENLQIISHEENVSKGNSSRENSSSYLGVCWDKDAKKWRSGMCIEGRSKYIGLFDTEIASHRAYQNAKMSLKTNNQK